MNQLLIPDLEHGYNNPPICVRVSRFWEYRDQNDEETLHNLSLVLVDEKGASIAAYIYPPLNELFGPVITEGKVYYLTYYWVKPSSKNYKPVNNKISINFTKWSTLQECINVPDNFPRYAYSLTPYNELRTRIDRKDSFTDVIGVITEITSVTAIQTRVRDGGSLKRTVYIRDADNVIINVALWGERATSFPAEKIINASKEEPQIVIFLGTLVRGYIRNVSLSGNSACKWFINIDAPEVNSFRASIQGKNEPIQFTDIPAPSAVVGPEKKTVAEIKELHPFKFKKHEFQVTMVIKKLCTESSWWYTACDTCKKTARPHGNAYRCPDPTCPPIVSASLRYKLNLIAGDDTAETTFILFGRLAQRLIGRSADVLLQENQTEKGCIPSAITDLLEKQFVWNVSITENTVATGNVSFQVNRIVGGAPGHALALLQSPSGSQASSLLPTMALSPTTSCDQSSALPSALDTPSVDINDAQLALTSPAITPIQATEEEETDQDDDHLPLTQKATAVTTRNSASKAYKKRPRPSPGTGAAKKLFKDADDKDAGGSDAPVA